MIINKYKKCKLVSFYEELEKNFFANFILIKEKNLYKKNEMILKKLKYYE